MNRPAKPGDRSPVFSEKNITISTTIITIIINRQTDVILSSLLYVSDQTLTHDSNITMIGQPYLNEAKIKHGALLK